MIILFLLLFYILTVQDDNIAILFDNDLCQRRRRIGFCLVHCSYLDASGWSENEWIATNNEIRFGFIVNNLPDTINVDSYETIELSEESIMIIVSVMIPKIK